MILAIVLFTLGLGLSAFFSGAETGFYRATRVRLLLDALAHDWIARGLLWATNHPALFVATALVGNNLANYLVSLGVVMGARFLFPGDGQAAEIAAPLLLAPIVFIYAELMPKYLFYQAPNRLLRRCGPGLLAAGILFSPVTTVLWAFNAFLQVVVRHSPQIIQLVLARRELAEVLTEGHQAGILRPAQQALVQGTFALAGQPVQNFAVPTGRYLHATNKMTPAEVLRLARRHHRSLIPVEDAAGNRTLLGYLRVVDLVLEQRNQLPALRPLIVLRADEAFLAALTRLMAADQELGQVVADSGKTIGFVTAKELCEALVRVGE